MDYDATYKNTESSISNKDEVDRLLCNLLHLVIDIMLYVCVEEVNGVKTACLMLMQKHCKPLLVPTRGNADNESYVVAQDNRELNSLSIGM